MKVSIKGLVFVGFAAAILSANAMAADNTVTSKSYVDNKFQVKSTAASIGGAEGEWTPLDTQITDNGASAPVTSAIKAYVDSAAAGSNFIDTQVNSSVTNKAPSDQAVYNYVGRGTLTVNQNSVSAGTFGANDTTSSAINIVAPNWDAAENTQSGILNKPTIANTSTSIDSAQATDTKVVPTTYAVQQYVADEIAALESAVDSGYQPVSSSVAVGNADGEWTALATTVSSTSDHTTAPTAKAVYDYVDGVESGLQSQIDDLEALGSSYQPVSSSVAVGNADGEWTALATTVSSTSDHTTAPTAKAVYDYVEGLPSSSLPGVDTTICDSTHPCALVTDTSTGAAKWVRIVQQGD